MFKVNNKNTRTTSMTSSSVFVFCFFRSGVSIVDFEQVHVSWFSNADRLKFKENFNKWLLVKICLFWVNVKDDILFSFVSNNFHIFLRSLYAKCHSSRKFNVALSYFFWGYTSTIAWIMRLFQQCVWISQISQRIFLGRHSLAQSQK